MQRLIPALLVLALLALALPAAPRPAAAQTGPTPLRADAPPAPPRIAAAPAAAELAQVASCRQALADPSVGVSQGSPWKVYRKVVQITTDSVTGSQALAFREDSDGEPSSGPDVDAAGQPFGPIPADLSELAGALTYRYEKDSTRPGDLLRVEIFADESLGTRIARRDLDVAALDTGEADTFEWEILDDAALAQLRGRASAVFVVSMVAGATGGGQRLWVDNLTAQLCVPGASIGGQVRKGPEGAGGASVLLVRSDAAGERVVASARADASGSFTFGSVPALTQGARYRLWFLNSSANAVRDDTRLGFWAGPVIASLAAGEQRTGLTMDIADVRLGAPAPEASLVATADEPARLTWSARAGVPGERHRFCLYDPQRADASGQPAQLCGPLLDPAVDTLAATITPASFAAAPGFGFAYGRTYRWYVAVYGGDPAADPNQQYGYSFYERSVTFLPVAPVAPPASPALPAGDPVAGKANADWTLLVYVAADNALGDQARAPKSARPAAQLAAAQAAAASPNVNIVSYTDGYGDGGAALCAYPAGAAPDCRARVEPNTAGPENLAEFIRTGRERYPATRTALLIISPGSAAGDLAPDESAGGDVLSLQELKTALAAAGLGTSAKLDLVIFQAPNLGTLDAARTVEPYARFMVAPADQIWQLGAIGQLVPLLGGAARADAAAAARGAVTAYQGVVDLAIPGRMVSIAAYNLARAADVAQAADDLAFVVNEALATDRAALLPILDGARRTAQAYDSSGNGLHNRLATPSGVPVAADEDALVDLRGLASALSDTPGVPGTVSDEANDLLRKLNEDPLVIASVQRTGQSIAGESVSLAGAGGLAVFFPGGQRLGGQPALTQGYLYGPAAGAPRDGDWATLLRTYLQGKIGQGPGGVTASPAGGGRLRPLTGGLVKTGLSLPLVRR
jgi:hypothetical protein